MPGTPSSVHTSGAVPTVQARLTDEDDPSRMLSSLPAAQGASDCGRRCLLMPAALGVIGCELSYWLRMRDQLRTALPTARGVTSTHWGYRPRSALSGAHGVTKLRAALPARTGATDRARRYRLRTASPTSSARRFRL